MLASWTIGLLALPVAVDPILPAGCPTATAIAAEIARLADAPAALPPADRLRLSIAPRGPRIEARLVLQRVGQAPAVRVLDGEASDCRALVSAVALTAALLAEPAPGPPVASLAPTAPVATPVATPAPVAAPAPSAPAAATATAAPRGGRPWGVHAGTHAVVGPLPGPGVAVEVGGRVGPPSLQLGLAARAQFNPPAQVDGGRVGGRLWAGVLTGCSAWGAVEGCGLATVGYQSLEGADFATNRTVDGLYLALGARGAWAFARAARWRLALVGEVAAPLSQVTLTASDREVWRSSRLVGQLGMDVGWRF